ncbi:MAG: hypothetical protein J5552_03585 [Prevotella sp.]|nr:hypothetical protein [Prevotella sp.]
MKKLFTFFAGLLLATTANAAVLVDEVVEGASYTYSGGWQGNWFNQGGDALNKDVTEYDYVWIQYKNTTGKIAFGIVYAEWLKTESWGETYYTDSKVIESESGVVGIPLEKTKVLEYGINKVDNDFKGDVYAKHVRQVFVQDQGVASNITVVGIWYGTEAEYQDALAGNKPVVAPKKPLDLTNLGTGWGNSTYDAETKTITIGDDWSGKGWWLATWDGATETNVGTDYSAYDKVAIEFAEATEANGKLNVEYDGGVASDSYEFVAGSTVVVVDMSAEGKKQVMQVYLQGPAGAKYVLKDAYFCTNEVAPEVPDVNATVTRLIWSEPFAKGSFNGQEFKSEDGTLVLTVTDEDGKQEVDANNAYFGTATSYEKFAYRLKSGGKSSSKNAMTLTIPADGTLKVYARTGSNGATDRTVVILQDEQELYNQIVEEANAVQVKINPDDEKDTNIYPVISVPVKAGTVNVTYPVGSINFYGFDLVTTVTGSVDNVKTVNTNSNVLYNLGGQKVDANYRGIVVKNGRKFFQK